MDRPQQPELDRSGHTPVDPEHSAERVEVTPRVGKNVSGPEAGRTRPLDPLNPAEEVPDKPLAGRRRRRATRR